MSNWTLREEIAKERFLDMMASMNKDATTNEIAEMAVIEADILMSALNAKPVNQYGMVEPAKTKGCPTCYGSGGKRRNGNVLGDCKVCDGTGRVPK